MASCPKCGRMKVRRDREGNRSCRHCGILRGQPNMDRSGNTADLNMACEAVTEELQQ